jgi:hypothetical protein
MFRNAFRSCVALSAAAILWCASDTVSLAAKAPVPVAGTAWATTGKVKAKAGKLGGLSVDGQGGVLFSPSEAVGLPTAGDFECEFAGTDVDVTVGATVTGTYTQDEKGKIQLVVNDEPLEAQITALILVALAGQGIVPDSIETTITKTTATAKTKSSTKSGETIKVKFSVKADVAVTLGPETETLKVNLSYSGDGPKADM